MFNVFPDSSNAPVTVPIEPGWTDVVNVSGWCESEKRRNEANIVS